MRVPTDEDSHPRGPGRLPGRHGRLRDRPGGDTAGSGLVARRQRQRGPGLPRPRRAPRVRHHRRPRRLPRRRHLPVPRRPRHPAPQPVRCADLASSLSLRDQVGQLMMVAVSSDGVGSAAATAIDQSRAGSVILLGNTTAGATQVASSGRAGSQSRADAEGHRGHGGRRPGRRPGATAAGAGLRPHPLRAAPGAAVAGRAEERRRPVGSAAAPGRDRRQPGSGRRCRTEGSGGHQRADRGAATGVRVEPGRGGAPRDGLHRGDGRRRRRDLGEALPRAGHGCAATPTSPRRWSTPAPPVTTGT